MSVAIAVFVDSRLSMQLLHFDMTHLYPNAISVLCLSLNRSLHPCLTHLPAQRVQSGSAWAVSMFLLVCVVVIEGRVSD